MLLNEVSPDSGIELHAIIGNQTLTFKEKTIAFHLDDKKLLKELNRLTKGYPFVVTPAIKKDDKVVGFPTSGVIYQLLIVNQADNKLYMWPNVVVKQIKLPDQPAYHFFISNMSSKEYNRRARYRLWLGVSGIATIGLNRTPVDVTIKDISSTGVGFIIPNKILEEKQLTLPPQSLVVLTFFDEASGSNFRLTCIVVRQTPADEFRTVIGCKFAEENRAIAQFIADRQRERLRDQRKQTSLKKEPIP